MSSEIGVVGTHECFLLDSKHYVDVAPLHDMITWKDTWQSSWYCYMAVLMKMLMCSSPRHAITWLNDAEVMDLCWRVIDMAYWHDMIVMFDDVVAEMAVRLLWRWIDLDEMALQVAGSDSLARVWHCWVLTLIGRLGSLGSIGRFESLGSNRVDKLGQSGLLNHPP